MLLLFSSKYTSQVSTYTFSESSGTYTALTSPTNLITSSATTWDDAIATATIPFTFSFNGVGYTTCTVNSNGFMTFGSTTPATAEYTPISSTTAYSGAISALGIDLYSNTTTGGNITYQTLGTSPNRTFVIQWNNAYRYNIAGAWNFQIRLSETTNVIRVVYGSCAASNNNNLYLAQIGLRGAANTDFNNRYLASNLAWSGNTTAGILNSDNVRTKSSALPASGTTFIWTPPCFQATALTASAVTANSATLSWTAPSPTPIGYEYYYSTTNTAPTGAGTAITTNSVNITGLSANTTYYWWVRAKCGTSSFSSWTSGGSFTTLCVAGLKTYCTKSFTTSVEPITNVTFAGINKTTSNTSTSSMETFCDAASVMQGSSYSISLKGNTVGNFTDYFRVYVDWDQNGTFGNNTDEVYDVGTITNSTGIDAITLTGSIAVPLTATVGNTRMRVVKNFNSYSDACTSASYGQVEDYVVTVTAIPACSGTPTGGTASATPTSGGLSSTFTASVSGSTSGFSGLAYQWESSPTGLAGSWTNIAGATAATATITAVSTETTTYYRRKITCTNSGLSSYSTTCTYTTVITYCSANVGSGYESYNYINKVSFLGTLQDYTQTSTYSSSPAGYQDFTGATTKSIQAQGNGINVYVETTQDAFYKAWVDWNKDGDFDDTGEQVYTSGDVVQFSTTFGFVIPSTAAPGNYRIRIRINDYLSGFGTSTFGSCGTLNEDGETEDYLFTVISNCSALINTVTDGSRCGNGSVTLQATATSGVTEFRWYSAETGGTSIGTSSPSGTSTSWSTPAISSTTTYYVTAYNGSCESLIRIPVTATIKPTPSVVFSPSTPVSCGANSVVSLSASGDNEIYYLIDENFEGGGLGVFTNNTIQDNGTTINNKTLWQNKTSTFVPAEKVWFPAISSGINGNKFAFATSDVGSYTINNALTSATLNTASFINLTLRFKMYYSRYYVDGTSLTLDFVNVEASTDGGTNWSNIVANITADAGIGTKFEQKTYSLNSFVGQSNLKIRIRYYGEWCDGVAIDDVELYGEKPLSTSFTWTSSHPINVYQDAAATTLYTAGTPATTVYIKPTASQMETYTSWNINANVLLGNGCTTLGTTTITNKNKIWNSTSTDWNTTNWLPTSSVPDASTCVIVKSPITLGTTGFAKNVRVEPTGKLTINSPGILTVTDEFVNNASAGDVTVQSDAGFVQVNDTPASPNSGQMTVKRNSSMKRLDYTYWSAPVSGQQLKAFSPLTVSSRFYVYTESTDLFTTVDWLTNFISTKGYAIRSPNNFTTAITSWPGVFAGTPNNGVQNFTLSYTPVTGSSPATHVEAGYNLVGNPYPSNIDFDALYTNNNTKIWRTAYFWTNNDLHPPATQQGSVYAGNNYAIYNGTGGNPAVTTTTPAAAPSGGVAPTQYIKVGQSFMIRAKSTANGQSLVFNNSVRDNNSSHTSHFFSKNSLEEMKDRYWLQLITPDNNVNTILIGYVDGATNGIEFDYDSPLLVVGSDSFYSVQDNYKLGIQGRQYPLNVDDVVSLGALNYGSGTYTVKLHNPEGVFANGQNIYLLDKSTGSIINLSSQNYSFQSDKGEILGRFEIVYRDSVMGTSDVLTQSIQVYRNGEDFEVKATDLIDSLEVFDSSGKLVKHYNANGKSIIIEGKTLTSGMYIIKIKQKDKITTRKILK